MRKQKITKRIVALAAAAMMLVGMIIPATAAPGDPEGSITVYKYGGNKKGIITNNTGEVINTATEDSLTADGFARLNGAEFTLYKANETGANSMATVSAAITATKTIAKHEINDSVIPPTIKFTMTDTTEIIVHTTYYDDQTTAGVAPNDGIATFGPLIPDGYYVLVETDVPADYDQAESSLIRLPITKADGTFNYDIHVYPKNVSNADLAKKEMNGVNDVVANGDIIPFELKAKFALIGGAANLTDGTNYGNASIKEELNNYFAAIPSTVKVYWLEADGSINPIPANELLASEWSVTPAVTTTPGADFTVSLTNAGMTKAKATNATGFGVALDVTYVGRPVAEQGDSTPLSNKMVVSMETYDGDSETIDDETYAPSISIQVDKIKSDGTPLDEVIFALAKVPVPRVNLNPSNPLLSSYTAAEQAEIIADYVLDGPAADPATRPLMAETDASGNVTFAHLEGYDDDDGAEFYLKEVATKTGYKLKVETIKVEFDTKANYQFDNPSWFDSGKWTEGAVIVEVAEVTNYELDEEDPDEPGFSLPLTGGAGTMMFTIAGIVVMLGAATLIIKSKKRDNA